MQETNMSKSMEVFVNAFTLGMACGVRKCLETLSKYEARQNASSSNVTGENENFEKDANTEVSNFLIATAKILNQFGDNLKNGAENNFSSLEIESLCDKCNLLTGKENKHCDIFEELVIFFSRIKGNKKMGDLSNVLVPQTEPQVDNSDSKGNTIVFAVAVELCSILEDIAVSMTKVVSNLKPKESNCAETLVSHMDSNSSEEADVKSEIKEETRNGELLLEDSQTKLETEAKEYAKVFSVQVYNTDDNKENDENLRETREIDSYHSCFDTGYGGSFVNEEEEPVSEQPSIREHGTGSGKSQSGLHGDSFSEVGGQILATGVICDKTIATDSSLQAHRDFSSTDITGKESIDTDDSEHSLLKCHEVVKESEHAITTEADNIAEGMTWKDEVLLSDIEYDSLTTTEDEEAAETVPEEANDCQELLELSAVRMFKNHMEADGVEVEIFPTPREQPTKQAYYTCRVLDFEAIGCGRSKKVAKRDAVSKMVRLIIKSHEDDRLPKEISPFSSEEISALEDVQLGGDDYLLQLRRLCSSENAPPPVFTMQIARGPMAEKIFSVKCSALGRTAVGMCTRKRSAKRRAAREIIKLHEEEKASAKNLDAAED